MELPLASPTGSVTAVSAQTPELKSRPAPAAPGPAAEFGRASSSEAKQPSRPELQQAVDELRRKAQAFAPSLRFSVDHDTGRTVVRVTDANTQEVIRQIPAEEVLKLAKEIDRMQGLLFHKQA